MEGEREFLTLKLPHILNMSLILKRYKYQRVIPYGAFNNFNKILITRLIKEA